MTNMNRPIAYDRRTIDAFIDDSQHNGYVLEELHKFAIALEKRTHYLIAEQKIEEGKAMLERHGNNDYAYTEEDKSDTIIEVVTVPEPRKKRPYNRRDIAVQKPKPKRKYTRRIKA